MSCLILTYHAQNVFDNCYGRNDHISLAQDIQSLQKLGKRLISLSTLVDCLLAGTLTEQLDNTVCITFDDGCKLEVEDEVLPPFGRQISFLNILKMFASELPDNHPQQVHATTFVIADEKTREQIDQESLAGRGWMTSGWWAGTKAAGLLDIQSHGWDHLHNMKSASAEQPLPHARFESVANFSQCEQQVNQASQYISTHCGGIKPKFFAYPFGKASTYMRESYLPEHADRVGIRAAFSTLPEYVDQHTSRWNIPRFVCGRDWQTPAQFKAILN